MAIGSGGQGHGQISIPPHTIIARGDEIREELTGAGERLGTNLWEAIWKANFLSKIKVFACKLASKAIAVRDGLIRRGVQVPSTCPM